MQSESGLITILEKEELITITEFVEKNNKKYHKYLDERQVWRNKRTDFTLCMIPRGLVKTTVFQVHRGAWYYLRDTIQKKQAPVIFLMHADLPRAYENLNLVKQVFEIPYIKYAFKDILKRDVDRVDRLNFSVKNKIQRKESHFITGSVGMDLG